MRIQTSSSTDASLQTSVRPATAIGKKAVDTVRNVAATANSAAVTLSSTAAFLSGPSDIDTAKIAAIKAAVQNGTYKVDSAAVANGMLSSARDLLSAASR
ncbi:flagellar biosynthesis anti-sigma factor FlgM [Burkholderia sp. 8Y]|uniref:flagellar biosynthesis anti-sigma factor FlgM n=1 Tax=Burkholderia sp. 8Y TaxID=2653133 RepID=UPI00135BDE29|nr:flagellar biosynthesis anti-sigma factor FlgM [Burkholderia sp. 8Y]